ncbi:hypothetical protein [Allorhizobium ampelinum]|uniref:hypothetical protein n=1 Tax=Allorhizobium ampelinum TaxID=3025782 RepID=UPI001F3AE3E6|nr:hypothetical protein [Allorhizobium ampelinum]
MAKLQSKIDIGNPFIPSQSTVCRTADALLLATLLISGIAAVISAILKWYIA